MGSEMCIRDSYSTALLQVDDRQALLSNLKKIAGRGFTENNTLNYDHKCKPYDVAEKGALGRYIRIAF